MGTRGPVRSFILRRLLLIIPVVWGTVTLLFGVFFLAPGDPVQQLFGDRAVPADARVRITHDLGLDRPWYVQYGKYLDRLAHGDLGQSYGSSRSVNTILKETAPASMRLAFWAVVLEVLIGIAAGLVSAVKRYTYLDSLVTVGTTMAVAVPVFVLGYLLQYVLGVYPFQHHFPRLPVIGIGPNSWTLGVIPTGSEWRYLLMPAMTLAGVSTALVARMMRTTMLEVQRSDYMRTAAAKGLSRIQVVLHHGLKNALIPVVTLIGLDLAGLIGNAVVTETVFNWPGLGSTLARAALARDSPIVLGGTLVLVVAYLFVNLAVDVSYAVLDPRIRLTAGAEV